VGRRYQTYSGLNSKAGTLGSRGDIGVDSEGEGFALIAAKDPFGVSGVIFVAPVAISALSAGSLIVTRAFW